MNPNLLNVPACGRVCAETRACGGRHLLSGFPVVAEAERRGVLALGIHISSEGAVINPNKALWEKGDFTEIAAFMRSLGGYGAQPVPGLTGIAR